MSSINPISSSSSDLRFSPTNYLNESETYAVASPPTALPASAPSSASPATKSVEKKEEKEEKEIKTNVQVKENEIKKLDKVLGLIEESIKEKTSVIQELQKQKFCTCGTSIDVEEIRLLELEKQKLQKERTAIKNEIDILKNEIVNLNPPLNVNSASDVEGVAAQIDMIQLQVLPIADAMPIPTTASHTFAVSSAAISQGIQEVGQQVLPTFDVFSMEISKENLKTIYDKLEALSKSSESILAQLDIEQLNKFKSSIEGFLKSNPSNIKAMGALKLFSSIFKKVEEAKKAESASSSTVGFKAESVFSIISSSSSVSASSIPPSITSATSSSVKSVYEVPKPNPINKDNLQAWVNAHPDNVKNAVQALANSINYVTHRQFMDNLAETLALFEQFARTHAPFTYVSAVQVGKSNKWVSDLAMSLLDERFHHEREVPLAYASYLNSIVDKVISGDSIKSPGNIVLFDDAVYTGEQMSRVIDSIIRVTTRANETLNKAKKPLIQPPRIIVACPFMAKRGWDSLKQIGETYSDENGDSLLVILYVENIPTIAEALKDKPDELAVLQQMYWNQRSSSANLSENAHLQISSASRPSGIYSVCLTYFDHKVPDWLSFPEALAEGKVFNLNGEGMSALPDTHQIIQKNKKVYE